MPFFKLKMPIYFYCIIIRRSELKELKEGGSLSLSPFQKLLRLAIKFRSLITNELKNVS